MNSKSLFYKWVNLAIKWLFRAAIVMPLLFILYFGLIAVYENFRVAIGHPTEASIKKTTGYCYALGKYLSDQDLTDIAVTRLLNNLDENYLTLTETEKVKRVTYKSLAHFYDVNPRCCPVVTKPGDWEYGKARIARFKKHGTYNRIGNSIHGQIFYQPKVKVSVDKSEYHRYGYTMTFCGEHLGPLTSTIGVPSLKGGLSTYPDRSLGKQNDK